MIRKNEGPLQQLSRRYSELNNFNMPIKKTIIKNNNAICFEKVHSNRPLIIEGYNFVVEYKILRIKIYTIHFNNASNNYILFKNGTVIFVLNLIKRSDNTKIIIDKNLKAKFVY